MKVRFILFLFLLACSVELSAQTQATQNPIVGTWKMTAQTIINPDGKSSTTDMSKLQQYKIISPTQWMFVNYHSDSLKGGGEYGTYSLQGNKYVENLSWAKTDYDVKVDGSKFYMEGTLIYPDGKKWVLKETYEKMPETSTGNQDLVGTWEMVSTYDIKEGKKVPVTNLTSILIITPTYHMGIDKKEGKFESGIIGTYTRKGNKVTPSISLASYPTQGEKIELTIVDLTSNQMVITGKAFSSDGKVIQEWGAASKRVGNAKIAKTTSN